MNRRIPLLVLALSTLVAVLVGWMLMPNTLFYRRGRPTQLGRVTNRGMSWLASIGMPVQVTLDVPARQSGRRRTTVLVPVDVDGERYLISMLGQRSDWVKNVRAGTGPVYIKHGCRREVTLEEVPVEERAVILKAYLHRAPGARPHFPLSRKASEEEFARIADQYPVFRVVLVGDKGLTTPPDP